jgi:hypothetical protein
MWIKSRSDRPVSGDAVDAALASRRARPSRPCRLPCPKLTTSLSECCASVRARHRRCPVASAAANPSTVSGALSTPLPPFSPGILAPELPLPPHPNAGPRQQPEPPPRRRTPPPSRFFHPSRRQEAPVSCRLHPLARRVASPPWMLERLTLFHLRHGSTTTDRDTTRARRAVTAPVCARAPHAVPHRPRPAQQGRWLHTLCKQSASALWMWAAHYCATGLCADSAQ